MKLNQVVADRLWKYHGSLDSAITSLVSLFEDDPDNVSSKSMCAAIAELKGVDPQTDDTKELIQILSDIISDTCSDDDLKDDVNLESVADKKPVLNEDTPYLDLGGVFTRGDRESANMPFMRMGGVFNPAMEDGFSSYLNGYDIMKVRTAITDLFKLHPKIDSEMLGVLADKLGVTNQEIEEQVYSILSSFWHCGDFSKNPNHPIDPKQLELGIQTEMEHTCDPLIAERIARDHLSGSDPSYYTHLAEMEHRYGGEKKKK